MKLDAFFYDLPAERIAQEPVEPRDSSRLLVIDSSSNILEHKHFHDIENVLKPGDSLVLNATKVFPARLRGRKKTGGKMELLLLEPLADSTWRTLVRGATAATELEFPGGLLGSMQRRLEEGEWEVRFSGADVRETLEKHGEMPLPPYIKRPEPRAADLGRYQTVFARQEGAVAAPTAGFHFTPKLLERLRAKGVQILEIVLHVGWGTFRPVRTETVEDHRMLAERYLVTEATATALNAVRSSGGRIIAVGTTAVRTLESICDAAGHFKSGTDETSLFIYPGYAFKAIDGLITNFHLPDSTPLLLANAFHGYKKRHHGSRLTTRRDDEVSTSSSPAAVSGGPTLPFPDPFSLRSAYESAIHEGYRFYSYGDAMVIL
jgi:S-adenosylmethionine:tRNA ribosyltransferase-isomerase